MLKITLVLRWLSVSSPVVAPMREKKHHPLSGFLFGHCLHFPLFTSEISRRKFYCIMCKWIFSLISSIRTCCIFFYNTDMLLLFNYENFIAMVQLIFIYLPSVFYLSSGRLSHLFTSSIIIFTVPLVCHTFWHTHITKYGKMLIFCAMLLQLLCLYA